AFLVLVTSVALAVFSLACGGGESPSAETPEPVQTAPAGTPVKIGPALGFARYESADHPFSFDYPAQLEAIPGYPQGGFAAAYENEGVGLLIREWRFSDLPKFGGTIAEYASIITQGMVELGIEVTSLEEITTDTGEPAILMFFDAQEVDQTGIRIFYGNRDGVAIDIGYSAPSDIFQQLRLPAMHSAATFSDTSTAVTESGRP
ncbi:MAG: hypothetical protein QF554_10740, partial [Dehalococcoidia bacterium]|nr:hypothetical protein [Dehalococcoidia bacterium]